MRAPIQAPLALGLGMVLTLSAAPAPAKVPPVPIRTAQAAAFNDAARACYQRRELACALREVHKARTTDPAYLPARTLLGLVLLAGGNVAAAETALDLALKAGADRSEVATPLAQALRRQGQPQAVLADPRCATTGLSGAPLMSLLLEQALAAEALGELNQALDLVALARSAQPAAALPWLAEVPLRLRLQQLPLALAAAERALALEPGLAAAEFRRATVAQAQGDGAAALAGYGRALAADAGDIEARLARAGLLLELRRSDEALTDLNELQARAPRDPRALYLLALRAEQRGQAAAVKAALREITAQIDPQPAAQLRYQPAMLLLGGIAHFGLGELAQALQYLERYRQSQGDNVAAKLLGQLYLNQQRPDEGVALLQGYVQAQPADTQALSMLAMAQLSQGRLAQAVALMREALRAQDQAELHTTLGLALLRSGQVQPALDALQTALQRDPKDTRAARSLIDLRLQLQQGAQALPLARALAQREPGLALHQVLLGRALAQTGDSAAARAAYQQALQLDASNSAAHLDLARMDIAERAWPAARGHLSSLLQRPEAAVDARLLQAQMQEAMGQAADAAAALDGAALQADASELRPLLALIELQLRRQQPKAAVAAAQRALLRAPADFAVQVHASRAYLAAGQLADARRLLLRAAALSPTQPAAAWVVARLQVMAGDALNAARTLDRALQAQPQEVELLASRAEVDLALGAPDLAEQRARRIVALQPQAATGHTLLADVAMARQRPAAALAALRRAHELAGNSASLLRLYTLQLKVEGPAPAQALLVRWLQDHPGDLLVRNALGDAQWAAGQLSEARASFERLLQQAPQANAVRNNLAQVLLRLNDPGALALAEQALAAEPGNADILDTAAWAAFKAGQSERALQLLRDASQRQPGAPGTRYHLAAVLAATGQASAARAELQAVLAAAPRFAERAEAEALLRSLPAR